MSDPLSVLQSIQKNVFLFLKLPQFLVKVCSLDHCGVHAPAIGLCSLLKDVTDLGSLEEVNLACLVLDRMISLLLGLKIILFCLFYRLSNTILLATEINRGLHSALPCLKFHAVYLLILNPSVLNELATCLLFFFSIFHCQSYLFLPLSLLLLLHLYNKV